MYQFKVMNEEELRVFLSKNEHTKECNESGWYIIRGFHYFEGCMSQYLDSAPEVYNFVALEDNQLVGIFRVIRNMENTKDTELWIDFIDVHKDHRKRGIARSLYQLFNTWVKPNPDYILIGTCLSKDGDSAKLHHLRSSIITNCYSFTTKEELAKHKMKMYTASA